MTTQPKCLYCDKPGVNQWTLSSERITSVARLCDRHVSAPIAPTAQLASDQNPLFGVRRRELSALDWTPPTPAPLQPAV